jgi:FtsH-binding integral membrane protein
MTFPFPPPIGYRNKKDDERDTDDEHDRATSRTYDLLAGIMKPTIGGPFFAIMARASTPPGRFMRPVYLGILLGGAAFFVWLWRRQREGRTASYAKGLKIGWVVGAIGFAVATFV